MVLIIKFFNNLNKNLFRPNLVLSIIVILQFFISTPLMRKLTLSKAVNLEAKWDDYKIEWDTFKVYLFFIIFFNFFYLIYFKFFDVSKKEKITNNNENFFLDIFFYIYFFLIFFFIKFFMAFYIYEFDILGLIKYFIKPHVIFILIFCCAVQAYYLSNRQNKFLIIKILIFLWFLIFNEGNKSQILYCCISWILIRNFHEQFSFLENTRNILVILFILIPINHLFKCQSNCEINPFSSMIIKQQMIIEQNSDICKQEDLHIIKCNINLMKRIITDPFFGRIYNYEISFKTNTLVKKENSKLNLDIYENIKIFFSSNILNKFLKKADNTLNGASFNKILSINKGDLSTGLTLASYMNSYITFGLVGLLFYSFIISLYFFYIYEIKLRNINYIFIFPLLYTATLHDTENFLSIALNKQIIYWTYIILFIITIKLFLRIRSKI